MDNHFHLVLQTPQANLVAGMKWLLGTYTSRFNRRHKEFGHLFSGRYKSLVVDGSQSGYLKMVCDYVHPNPVRAKLLRPEAALSDFVWSSYPLYLAVPSDRPDWLRVQRLLAVMMSFARSCWNKPRFVGGAVIMGRSSRRQPKRRRNGWSKRVSHE